MTMSRNGVDHASQSDHESNEFLDLVAPLTDALGSAATLPLRPQDADLLTGAEPFSFGPDNSRKAWSFGEGPLVILVHGYSGRGVQMAALARHLSAAGFRSVIFDAGGHGLSRPERIGFHTFMADTRDLLAHLGSPVHTLVGHSAGALAMMRARGLYDVSANAYVAICAPLFPYVPLETMRSRGVPAPALDHIKAVLSDHFQMSWSALVRGEAFAPEQGKGLLAIYDDSDEKVRHTDADVLAEIWPGSRVVKTTCYGHNRILRAEETLSAVLEFVKSVA